MNKWRACHSWLRFADTIQAVYKDITGRHFFLSTYQDRKHIYDQISEVEFLEFDAATIGSRDINNASLRHRFLLFIQDRLQRYNNNIDWAIADYNEFYDTDIR